MKNRLYNTVVCLLFACTTFLQAQAPRVTLEGSFTLEEAFRSIEQQTGAIISYNRSRLDTTRPYLLYQSAGPLENVLGLLLENTGFTYRLKHTGQLHVLIVPAKQPQPTTSTDTYPAGKPNDTFTYRVNHPQPVVPVSASRSFEHSRIPAGTPVPPAIENDPFSASRIDYISESTVAGSRYSIRWHTSAPASYPYRLLVVRNELPPVVFPVPFRVQYLHRPAYSNGQHLASVYSDAQFSITPRLNFRPGITAHYFSLYRDLHIEPRVQLLWKVVSNHTLAVRYGFQSRQGYTHHYKPWQPGRPDVPVHPRLSFTKKHHIAATWHWQPATHTWLQAEGIRFFPERPFTDPVQPNLQAGYRFMVKVLAGRDWKINRDGSQTLGTNLRVVWLGGHRNGRATSLTGQELAATTTDNGYDRIMPNAPALETALSLHYRISQQRVTHDFSVKIVTSNFVKKELYPYQVRVEKEESGRETVVVPNVSYQITF